jgi:hypothetical protein
MFLYGSYGKAMNTNESIRTFTVTIDQADLDDLQQRLARTRLPEPAPGDDWDYGTPNHYLRDMVDRWQNTFDWRAQEARMNEFPHHLTEIDGQTVHFIHVPSKVENATPLLLIHTYPGSFVDFFDMIGPLTDPEATGSRPRFFSRALKIRPCLSSSAPCRVILGARARSLSGTSAAMRAFSQPPWDSPLAAMEQKRRNASSLSRISWKRLLAESIGGTSLPLRGPQVPHTPRCTSQVRERGRGNRCGAQLRRKKDGRGRGKA